MSLAAFCEAIRVSAQNTQTHFEETTQHKTKSKESKHDYEVIVHTGDRPNAGTDANILLTLIDKKGNYSSEFKLDSSSCIEDKKQKVLFKIGKVDKFGVDHSGLDEIVKIRIGHDGVDSTLMKKAPIYGWFLDKVEIIDPEKRTLSFVSGRWFCTELDDFQIVRDIPVEHKFSLSPIDFSREVSDNFETKDAQIKSFAPKVFRNLREFYDIHTDDYVSSWNLPEEKLVGKEGAGRSGSLFLRSNDNKFFLKTIPHDEVESFLTVLPSYYEYFLENRFTLIMKVFGVFRVTCKGLTSYAIVFCNCLYNPERQIDAIYDLKGRVPKPGKHLQNTSKKGTDYVFKDKDLDRKFHVKVADKINYKFYERLSADINFFAQHNLMDYSFLIGVSKFENMKELTDYPPWAVLYPSEDNTEVFHFGFIDCLTQYGLRKKTANFFKNRLWNEETLSTIDAVSYANRIKNYLIKDVFDTNVDELQAGSSTEVKVTLLEQRVETLERRLAVMHDMLIQVMEEKGLAVVKDDLDTKSIDHQEWTSPLMKTRKSFIVDKVSIGSSSKEKTKMVTSNNPDVDITITGNDDANKGAEEEEEEKVEATK